MKLSPKFAELRLDIFLTKMNNDFVIILMLKMVLRT